MKRLRISMVYGEDEFTTTIHPPATAHEYHAAILDAIGILNSISERWAYDARQANWESITDARSTVEEF